jgi:hypothetical protein
MNNPNLQQVATTPEQGKTLLATGVPWETADMFYNQHGALHAGNPFRDGYGRGDVFKAYAWSLTALLNVLYYVAPHKGSSSVAITISNSGAVCVSAGHVQFASLGGDGASTPIELMVEAICHYLKQKDRL